MNKDNNQPKSVNEILKEMFLKEFNNARKQAEAEEKQRPFAFLVYNDNQGQPIHAMRFCNN
jgi:hypothetical protein